MRFQVVCLSITSVPTLCLKYIENDTIHPELLNVGVIRGNKIVSVLATQKQEELSANN